MNKLLLFGLIFLLIPLATALPNINAQVKDFNILTAVGSSQQVNLILNNSGNQTAYNVSLEGFSELRTEKVNINSGETKNLNVYITPSQIDRVRKTGTLTFLYNTGGISAQPQRFVISFNNGVFSPSLINAKIGDTIQFQNTGSTRLELRSYQGQSINYDLNAGQNTEFLIQQIGDTIYYDRPSGVTGTIRTTTQTGAYTHSSTLDKQIFFNITGVTGNLSINAFLSLTNVSVKKNKNASNGVYIKNLASTNLNNINIIGDWVVYSGNRISLSPQQDVLLPFIIRPNGTEGQIYEKTLLIVSDSGTKILNYRVYIESNSSESGSGVKIIEIDKTSEREAQAYAKLDELKLALERTERKITDNDLIYQRFQGNATNSLNLINSGVTSIATADQQERALTEAKRKTRNKWIIGISLVLALLIFSYFFWRWRRNKGRVKQVRFEDIIKKELKE